MMRRLLVLLLFCLCTHAYALIPVVNSEPFVWRGDVSKQVFGSEPGAACASEIALRHPTYSFQSVVLASWQSGECMGKTSTGPVIHVDDISAVCVRGSLNTETRVCDIPPQCPANSTQVSGGCQCNSGFDQSGSQCVPHVDQCSGQTGKTGVLNWTEGYTRTPDEGDRKAVGTVYSPPSSGNVCLGSCSVSLQTSGPGVQPLVSQAPTSQGLYRRSVDYPYVALGTSCNPGVADVGADKNATPPDCPGTVGEYSGHPVCVGTAAKPVIASGMPQAPGSTPIAGNPTAGDKPATGEGSGSGSAGRTPSSGDGTAKGGPADAGKGGKGGEAGGTADGTGVSPKRTDDKQPDPCGAPSQPECSVRVNEKGTPDGAGTTFDVAKGKMDETKGKNDDQLQRAAGTSDKGFLEPVRSMFWAPPIAACEPVELPSRMQGLKVDACGVVDGGRSIMAFLWAAGGLFLCLGMIKRSI